MNQEIIDFILRITRRGFWSRSSCAGRRSWCRWWSTHHLLVPGGHPDPGIDLDLRPQDDRHLRKCSRPSGRGSARRWSASPSCGFTEFRGCCPEPAAAARPAMDEFSSVRPTPRSATCRELMIVALILSRTMPMILLTPYLGASSPPTEVKMGLGLVLTVVLCPSPASRVHGEWRSRRCPSCSS